MERSAALRTPFDAHAHVYPDAFAPRATAGIAAFYGLPVRFDGRVDTLTELMDRAGIGRALVCAVATTPASVGSINRHLAEVVRASNGRLAGFAAIHPESADVPGDVARAVDSGLRGVKLHPDFQRCPLDGEATLRAFEAFAGTLPALIHLGDARYDFSSPARAARLLRTFPEAAVIGAHLGGWTRWEEGAEALSGFPNLYVDTSSSLYELAPDDARRLIRRFGADRALFGSDYPMWDPGEELNRVRALGLTRAEEDSILFGNADRLFGPCGPCGTGNLPHGKTM